MPLNPQIPLMAGQGVTPIASPFENAKNAQGMRDIAAKKQAQEQARADDQAFYQIASDAKGDVPTMISLARSKGLTAQAADLEKNWLSTQKTLSELDETRRKQVQAKNEDLGKAAAWADTPEKWAVAAREHPELGNDPGQRGKFVFQASTIAQILDQPVKAQAEVWKEREFKLKERDTAAREMNARKTGGGSANTWSPGKTGDLVDDPYLDSLPTVRADLIRKIGEGKYGTVDALKRNKEGQALLTDFVRAGGSVADLNNAVKFQEDMRKTQAGTVGGTYMSVNKSTEHLQRALDNLAQMPQEKEGTPYWLVRGNIKEWELANPGKASPLKKNWEMITSALQDETEKSILGGKPSVDQARTIEKLKAMPFTATKAEKLAAMQAVIDLTMGQYDAVEAMRKQVQGKFAKADSMLTPNAQKTLTLFNSMLDRENPEPGTPTPPRTSMDAASPMGMKRPSEPTGPTATDSKGNKIMWNGSAWVSVK